MSLALAWETPLAARSADSRRAYILDQVATRGHVGVRELADDMDVSEATVRRDLRDLAQQQRLQLVYGGATVPRSGGWGAAGDQSIETRAQKPRS